MTQAELAKKVSGVTSSDISKAERGEKELSQAALKQIAKATGVTQSSLLNAPKGASGKSSKTSSEPKLSSAEKKLIELYRAADSDTKKAAVSLLKGEKPEGSLLSSLFSGAVDTLLGSMK